MGVVETSNLKPLLIVHGVLVSIDRFLLGVLVVRCPSILSCR